MAVFIEATYSKKLGLPSYSSHEYRVSIRSEITDLSELPSANEKLYRQLQDAVDRQIQNTGFSPRGGTVHQQDREPQGNGETGGDAWSCSDRQRELILRIVNEGQLNKGEVDELARKRFGSGVRQLIKLQASALIDELLEKTRANEPSRRGGHRQSGYRRTEHAR